MQQTVSLDGAWRLRQAGADAWLPATVPGCVHTDLMAAGKIPDPLAETNELDVLWIDETDWDYERIFKVSDTFLQLPGKWLVCEGLDTIAEIFVNEQPVGHARNMFRRYRFDVGSLLRSGENRIRIRFQSPVRYGAARAAEDAVELPGSAYAWGGTDRTRKVYRPYVRKAQYQFGWDWGPCLATSGVWRSIGLVGTNAPVIDYLTTRQEHEGRCVRLTVDAHLCAPRDTRGRLMVTADGRTIESETLSVVAGESRTHVTADIEAAKLWWPVGMGEPHLYSVTARWVDDTHGPGTPVTHHVGLRRVELMREPDADGESFLLRINGKDVFCKGANWIPADSFPARVDAERYARLIRSAIDANMNMLRVWGGGIYEDETFYRECDRNGIMVWQDIMFACAAYPDTDEFYAEVRAEVRHQMRRLANHPSIVLWCGNNENEWMIDNWWAKEEQFSHLRESYDRLAGDVLAPLVAEEAPDCPWWPSSPSNGGSGKPNDPLRGDVHAWDVWSFGKTHEYYLEILPRFCSEFGYQALPTFATLTDAVGGEPGELDDPVLLHRQRAVDGNRKIADNVRRLFGEPRDLAHWCYLSQLLQGVALSCGVEHWRRNKPRCMGALYWQLNDCWPVTSWATVDYNLRYKASHYFAKRFFAPLLGSIVETDGQLNLWATSDIDQTVEFDWRVEAWRCDGKMIGKINDIYELDAQASMCFATVPIDALIQSDADNEQLLIRLVLCSPAGDHENLHVRGAYKDLPLLPAKIDTDLDLQGEAARIRVSTDVPALFVELDSGPLVGMFSDNYFVLLPGDKKEVTFTLHSPAKLSALRNVLAVRSF